MSVSSYSDNYQGDYQKCTSGSLLDVCAAANSWVFVADRPIYVKACVFYTTGPTDTGTNTVSITADGTDLGMDFVIETTTAANHVTDKVPAVYRYKVERGGVIKVSTDGSGTTASPVNVSFTLTWETER